MNRLKHLLQERNLVIELWWSQEGRCFYGAYSYGSEPDLTTQRARTLPGLIKLIEEDTDEATD